MVAGDKAVREEMAVEAVARGMVAEEMEVARMCRIQKREM